MMMRWIISLEAAKRQFNKWDQQEESGTAEGQKPAKGFNLSKLSCLPSLTSCHTKEACCETYSKDKKRCVNVPSNLNRKNGGKWCWEDKDIMCAMKNGSYMYNSADC